jgi:acetyltransferase-like isoleucine patch superfamily enzyme
MFEILRRIQFWEKADRLGPDILSTHLRLYFKPSMLKLCQRKFKFFDSTAEFRPGAYAVSCSKISLGKRVIIRPGCVLMADPREDGHGITIEDDVLLGHGVHIYVSNHSFQNPQIPIIDQGSSESKLVILKKGCWIGANAIILPGVTIGENSVVGAGSIVTTNIPDRVVAVGNPAKVIKKIG